MIADLIRPNIKKLQPYSSARDEFQGADAIFLDANENPYGVYNRYPDPHQVQLKTQLAVLKNIPASQIFIGNGSDEIIDLTLRIFCEPGKDKILTCPPTYGMYEVAAQINNIQNIEVPLTPTFQLNTAEVITRAQQENVKVIFLCSPNNPTGNSLDEIQDIIENFQGIVFIDEAYIDFSNRDSYSQKLTQYPNLIISQTFSKARALAGARVGIAYASTEIIQVLDRVKPPYNVSSLNQKAALKTLKDQATYKRDLEAIRKGREFLLQALKKIKIIKKIYPTDANFILFEVENAPKLYSYLVENKVIIRNRDKTVQNTLRANVGRPEENQKLIEELKKYEKVTAY